VIVGGLVIIVSVTYISYREMKLNTVYKIPQNNLTKL